MLKGVNKQIIEINDTGNDYFERVLLFVKPAYHFMSTVRLEATAKNYINSLVSNGSGIGYLRNRERKKRTQLWVALCGIIGIGLVLVGLSVVF